MEYLSDEARRFGTQNDGRLFFDEFVDLLAKRERQAPGEDTDPKVSKAWLVWGLVVGGV